ncbi:MAG TPA: LysR family transcriptional regulator [Crenalkalicoccus sp.]|nr:LysR family transcriptional regulator [Crenalkalicoccus sp.]
MDRVRRIEMLVRAAEAGSFSKAAAALRLTPSAVSHGIAELEGRLRLRLFHRTTRQLRLTAEGEAVYRRAREIVDRLDELESAAAAPARSGRLTGTLRVGAAIPISRGIIAPRLASFLARHPELRVELLVQNEAQEMHSGGMDLLLRVGPLADSQLVARRLALLRFVACAAPAYLEAAGEPKGPNDLLRHRCLVHKPPFARNPWDEWAFERSGERRRVVVPAALMTDDREALLAAALAGAGVIRVGMFDPGLLASGALRRILSDWSCPGGPTLNALYRRTPGLVPKVAAFLDFAAAALADFDPEGLTLTLARISHHHPHAAPPVA